MKTVEDLERSFKKAHRIIERAQKRASRSGKDKSLLKMVCHLGGICHKGPVTRDGKRYVNPHVSGETIYFEEVGTYKYVEFKNGEFMDMDNKPIVLLSYKDI